MTTVKIESSDGEIFTIDLEVVKVSETIKTMLEGQGLKADDEQPLPITNVDSVILKKVFEWCDFHKNDPPPPPEEPDENEFLALPKRSDDLSTWDTDFLSLDQGVDRETLFHLTNAASLLKIPGLLDATCKTIANIIRGKSVEEIRIALGIENDFGPEEEAEIRAKNFPFQ